MEQNGLLYLTSDASVLFDSHYRYKIVPIDISSITKKGTQITLLNNFDTFCEQLIFDKIILLKIIGKQLHCKTGTDKSTGKPYLQGLYNIMQVKDVIYSFIQKYLLCTNCDKPEVNLKYKNGKIKQKCRACGNNVYLENCKEEIIHILK